MADRGAVTGQERQQQIGAVWAEPLTENERAVIARAIASGDAREVTRWMNHVLACYDGLAARLSGLQDTLAATEARFFGQRRVLIEFMAFGTELLRDNWLEDREAERMIDLIATARANFDLALNTDGETTEGGAR